MKSMNDRKMDMKRGEPESESFFPEAPHYKMMARASDIRKMKYPDTEEQIHSDQEGMIRSVSSSLPKAGFRH